MSEKFDSDYYIRHFQNSKDADPNANSFADLRSISKDELIEETHYGDTFQRVKVNEAKIRQYVDGKGHSYQAKSSFPETLKKGAAGSISTSTKNIKSVNGYMMYLENEYSDRDWLFDEHVFSGNDTNAISPGIKNMMLSPKLLEKMVADRGFALKMEQKIKMQVETDRDVLQMFCEEKLPDTATSTHVLLGFGSVIHANGAIDAWVYSELKTSSKYDNSYYGGAGLLSWLNIDTNNIDCLNFGKGTLNVIKENVLMVRKKCESIGV